MANDIWHEFERCDDEGCPLDALGRCHHVFSDNTMCGQARSTHRQEITAGIEEERNGE